MKPPRPFNSLGLVVAGAVVLTAVVAPPLLNAVPRNAQLPAPLAIGSAVRGNGRIAFTSNRNGNNDIFLMNMDGSDQVSLTGNPASDTQPAVSPDGRKIAFTSNRLGNNDIFVMGIDGSNPTPLTGASEASDSQPDWSPDGTKIAFTSNRDGNDEVYVMNANGSNQVDLTNRSASDSQPAFSPDGASIAFTSNRNGNQEIYTENLNGHAQTNRSTNPAADSMPAWSPDGTKIAFTSNRDGNNEIYLMGADGTGQANKTNDPGSDSQPVFSPDGGTRIDFASDRTGNNEIFQLQLLRSDGTFPVNITYRPGSDSEPAWQPLPPWPASPTPIEHVVVLYQENHSFDNVFGRLCVIDDRCDGVTKGELHDGTIINLPTSPDITPPSPHGYNSQVQAINGGQMNGFSLFANCTAARNYPCYTQFDPDQIPNLSALARAFVISDRTFESHPVGSWGAHLDLAAAHLDGFYTGTHHSLIHPKPPGWGCDSGRVGAWRAAFYAPMDHMPTCIPKTDGSGPFLPSEVPWVPTIMDRMQQAGLTWRLYAPFSNEGGYGWSICPTFAECLNDPDQLANWVSRDDFIPDAQAGRLANLSLVIPAKGSSQHNSQSMLKGDNYLGDVVSAIMNGPDWDSTAIFITYDDCGCFYDHVPPPEPKLGIREPMVIISPWVRPGGFTDSNVASFDSMLAFTEHNFGLAPLAAEDAEAYAYQDSFDYSQEPLGPIPLGHRRVPAWEIRYIRAHPGDPNDPT